MFPLIDETEVYVAVRQKVATNGKTTFAFGVPIKIQMTIGLLNADRSMQLFGEQSGNAYEATINLNRFIKLAVGDRLWIDLEPPATHDQLASTADYTVDAAFTQHQIQNVVLRKIQ